MKSVMLIMLAMLICNVFAASGNYAHMAKASFSQGKYEVAYGQYELALKEARKEANLAAEGRILISMAMLATHAMEYEEAKKIFDMVKTASLDNTGKEDFCRAYMEFYNLQGEYRKAFDIAKNNSFKKPNPSFFGEAAIAAAGSNNNSEADSFLKKINKKDSPGQAAFYKARVADLKGENPIELYENALTLSIEKKRFFTTGMLMLRLAQITGNKNYAARSATVFRELGLVKPFQQAEELK